jgi:phage tail protein X
MAGSPAFTAFADQGETVDELVWRMIGTGSPAVEKVLDANRDLAALGARLPEGTPVFFPAIDAAPAQLDQVQLWE